MLQISEMFALSGILLANFFRNTVYVYKKAELIIFVDLKIILDSGERLPLVLSIAFKDVEGKILSENNLFDNSKKEDFFTEVGQTILAVVLKTKF